MALPRIKICCISSVEEARMAVAAGASALGFVGPMPSGPGVIRNELIPEIIRTVPPPVATFLLSSQTTSEGLASHQKLTHANTLQIVDHVPLHLFPLLRKALPHVKLVQVVHVLNEASVEEALAYAAHADALLLDSGNPHLKVKVLGGTGTTHDWTLSRKIVDQAAIPVFLAGGLTQGNARQALDQVNPYGLDVCSGVRTNGRLDPRKLEAFFLVAGY
ncbi:MAG: phosphoribosylanthranilate isomerase [Haliscomenobacter sp.]|nr:phosphoribosylanthranilate isomerase [Haliscomenobacter sp.]